MPDHAVCSMADSRPFSVSDREAASGLHPLGPLVYRVPAKRSGPVRLAAMMVFAGCAALFVEAARLDPSPTGMGTHRQLGLPPCALVVLAGYPCPTCGMTTAFAHAVRGQLVQAFNAQPAGLVLAIVTAVAAVLALQTVVTADRWAINWYRIPQTRLMWVCVLVFVAGWLYKLGVGIVSGRLPVP